MSINSTTGHNRTLYVNGGAEITSSLWIGSNSGGRGIVFRGTRMDTSLINFLDDTIVG